MANQPIPEAIFKMVHLLRRNLHEAFAQTGSELASMHINTLFIINANQPCTAANIAHILYRDKAQVTRLINDLIKSDWIEKTENPDDKRSQFLQLSGKGLAELKKIQLAEIPVIEQLTQNLTDKEIYEFVRLTKKWH
ncbi:MarR family winged helix-turn-helix transcriptional regulator [Marinicellulosiphila megalodicopiae]|uniref:MarR family winged helix-turn-helix transcriptional regulator n=1 Tax=Marinicellulosiphila megalodicopiae TaxID=2724896 RepID=UPI003BB00B79